MNMFVPPVNLKVQYEALKTEIDAAVLEVLSSGWYILGEQVKTFEKEFAEYLGVDHAVGVASGTDALSLALKAVGVSPGDEVITVSFTAVATVAAIEQIGAKPVFVDIDPATFTMNPVLLAAAVSERTRAIVPVHLYGHPADMEAIVAIARQHDLAVVEDCAQAHGAGYRDKIVGSFGQAAAFSFYPTKNLGAIGDGGLVATKNAKVAETLKMLRQYGWKERYISACKGGNSRLDEVQAAILQIKLKYLDKWNDRRRDLAHNYYQNLVDSNIILPHSISLINHVYHLYVVRSDKRNELHSYLLGQGIGAQIHYPQPVHLQPAYRDPGIAAGSLPETERAAKEVLSLPIYPEMSEEQVRIVVEAVKKWG